MKVKKKIESKRLRVLIVGGSSLLATALKPVLEKFCEVLTAGRQKGNDIFLDLRDPVKDFSFPDNIDVVIHMAAYFKGGTDAEMLEAENVNVLGTLKL